MTARRLLAVVLTAASLSGCVRTPAFMQPAPARDWRAALTAARSAADAGRWSSADGHLATYASRYPESDEAHESLYWRALFRLAPGNDTSARRLAVPTLQRYLATDGGGHRTEARVLLAVAESHLALVAEAAARERDIEEIRAALGRARERPAAAAAAPTTDAGGNAAPDRELAGEVERLRRDLATANAELERIRRRLAGERPR